MWPIKKMKKKPSQRHISKFAELDGGRRFSRIFLFYEDGNQTENFIRAKTGNDLYYRVKNTINPNLFVRE